MNKTIEKVDILNLLNKQLRQWREIKGQFQDVTQEDFIDHVLLVLKWIKDDVEKM